MRISMEPIGYVVNNVDSPVDIGWGEVESKIVIKEELATALKGLADFSHILVIFYMHQAQPPTVQQRRPQDRKDMPVLGLFAQRSKHRVNIVRGLDAINGTPVLDIKPYYPHYDCPSEVQVPEWVDRLMNEYF